jgi:hypothetical protein
VLRKLALRYALVLTTCHCAPAYQRYLTSPCSMPTLPPAELSRQLRLGQNSDLTRRRWIIGLSFVTVAAGQIVSLYQTGIISHLPDPPIPIFDSDKVDASDYGYKRLQMPDAPAMIITGGITATLAAAGGQDRATELPWLPVALLGKTLIDLVTNVQLRISASTARPRRLLPPPLLYWPCRRQLRPLKRCLVRNSSNRKSLRNTSAICAVLKPHP